MSTKFDMWLRLEDDFFIKKEIKKLRRLENGADCIIIYLKLMLLSIDNDGLLNFEGLEESIFEQLSLEIDESEELIKETIDFCIKNNLLEVDVDEYFLTGVPELLNCDGYCYIGD